MEEHLPRMDFGWLMILILIPLSLIYDLFWYVRIRLLALTKDINHDANVRSVQRQIRAWRSSGAKVPMCTARPRWMSVSTQSMAYKNRLHRIHVDLPDILHLDEERRLVTVEPMVTIGQLNDFLIGRGWTLPVVPELDDLTIGGLVMGFGIETTSHKYGLFGYTCRRYELVMADASVVIASETENPELFMAIPLSYGTLGFLTAVDIDVVPFKPFIKLTYTPVFSLDETVETLKEATEDSEVDSVEGIRYSMSTAVIMRGTFVDSASDPGVPINRLGRWYKEGFYKYVQRMLEEGKEKTEYVPTKDFFHRHNKSWFWLMENIFNANNCIFRMFLGWAMPPKFPFFKLVNLLLVNLNLKSVHTKSLEDRFICQDFGFRIGMLKEALVKCDEETKLYPVWLCPTRHRIPKGLEHLSIFGPEDIHIDVGLYGLCLNAGPNFDKVSTQRRLERYCLDTKSFVALYAETELTKDELEEMLGEGFMECYTRARCQFGCQGAFPILYDKISKAARN